MKMRIRKHVATTANASVSQYEIVRLRTIKIQRMMYGTNVLTICQMLRRRSAL